MKKLVVFALVLNALLLAGRLWQELPVNAQAGPGGPAVDERFCADANGDGKVDVSDPVTILRFLFTGGRPPYCVAQQISLDRFALQEELAALVARVADLRSQLLEMRSEVSVLSQESGELRTKLFRTQTSRRFETARQLRSELGVQLSDFAVSGTSCCDTGIPVRVARNFVRVAKQQLEPLRDLEPIDVDSLQLNGELGESARQAANSLNDLIREFGILGRNAITRLSNLESTINEADAQGETVDTEVLLDRGVWSTLRDTESVLSSDTATLNEQGLNSLIRSVEEDQESLRNQRQMAQSAFEIFDKKSDQLYSQLSIIMGTMREMRSLALRLHV